MDENEEGDNDNDAYRVRRYWCFQSYVQHEIPVSIFFPTRNVSCPTGIYDTWLEINSYIKIFVQYTISTLRCLRMRVVMCTTKQNGGNDHT
jgi:hypothetical protein